MHYQCPPAGGVSTTFTLFPFSFFFVFLSPDGAVAGVQVLCGDGADDGAGRRVLVHVHEVGGLVEDGRLVHVLHRHADRGEVLELQPVDEAGVQVGVADLHPELVVPLLLVVQTLEGGGRERAREQRLGGGGGGHFITRGLGDKCVVLTRDEMVFVVVVVVLVVVAVICNFKMNTFNNCVPQFDG